MKRRFTILTAALALLTFLAIPMGVWGQTSDVQELTNANIVAAGAASSSYASWSITDGNNHTWNAYAIKNKHSNATSSYHFLQIKKYASNTAYYIQVPELGTKITSITMTVSSASQPMTGGGNSATLYFSNSNSTSSTGTGVASGTGSSSVTIDCSSLNLNTGYITAGGAVRIWDVSVTYTTSGTPTPTMTVSTNSIDFGSNAINPAEPYTETFNVTFANLTENLTITGFSGVTVSPATINANATSPQTVTVSYNPTTAGSISGNISVNSSEVDEQLVAVSGSAYDPANVDTYERYTGALVEGDYVIYNTSGAMKSEISSNRFANHNVTVSETTIINPDESVIWHIAPIVNTNYWTIYNADVDKYAGGTSSKNQGVLLENVTDHAKWIITYQYSNWTIENYGRSQDSSDPNNKYLRQNGTSGWATYGNSTGSVPCLYRKVITNQVAAPTFSVVSGTYYETKTVELSCETSGATIYYTTDGTTPSASNGTEYTTAISVSNTMTIKAIAVKEGMTDSDVATAEYTIEQPYSTIPALFAAATATEQDVRVTFGNWVVSGVSTNGKSVYVTDNSGNGFLIYFTADMSNTFSAGNILSGTAVSCKLKLYNGAAELVNLNASDLTITDGGNVSIVDIAMASLSGVNTGVLVHYDNLTCSLDNNKYYLSDGTTTLQAYNTLYAFNEFEDGKTYNVSGLYVQYNSIKEIAPRSEDDIVEVQVQHDEYTLTVGNLVHVTTSVFDASDQSEALLIGAGQVDIYDGTEVLISVDVEEGYVIESLIVDGVDVTSQIDADAYTFTMPTNAVTVTATAVEYVAPTGVAYVLYTGELVEGDYLIVYDGGAMNTTVTSDRLQYEEVSATNNVIVTDNAEIVWHIAPSGQYWTIYNANADAYAASTGAKNKAQMLSDGTDDKALWTVSVSGTETYEFVNKKNAANNVNANLRKNGEYGFACYATSTGGALSLYKKVALPINGYGDDSNPGGYYLIASPLGTINPANVPGMLSDTYDLYYFDQEGDNDGNEWINYKGGSFNLEPGTGYLYAHNSTITLNFTGTPIEGPTYEVTLTKNESARFKGWNLVGNPFTKTAYIDNTHNAYYTMDAAGALFVPVTGNSVDPMEGIFVVAKSDEETITFSTTAPNNEKCSTLALNLSQGQSLLDRAIVRFDEGSQLPKLQFNRNSSKVCIPMDDEDYAVVRAEEMGEMPVNFKAESNGTYSLNFGMDNVEFAYLHLIDNLTGNEVDLLQTPSYSFEAKTTDYENRFKLVFATGDNSNEDNFAYFSNGSFVINNEGNATLQVIDITGRIVKSESVNGCANVNVNGAAGVYMLRLVNGDNVKVQKVVVK